jgi:hypothetical protein
MVLLPELLQGLGSTRLVIDGIDEWNPMEQKEFLKDLLQVLSTNPSSYICKILLASRDTRNMSQNLRRRNQAVVTMSLSESNERTQIDKSIENFVNDRFFDLPDNLATLDPNGSMLAQIKCSLLEKSSGRFLSSVTEYF